VKKIILFVALALPVLIFIFLKIFGRNEFDIPVYWTEGVPANIPGCKNYPVPYVLPDSVFNEIPSGGKPTLVVLGEDGIKNNLQRVGEQFRTGDYNTLLLEDASYEVKTCLLLAGDTSRVVLVDDQRRIRGYYTPTTRKETSRLQAELKILLKQY
jgi:hypothetical protein